jgi:hypothetical protein
LDYWSSVSFVPQRQLLRLYRIDVHRHARVFLKAMRSGNEFLRTRIHQKRSAVADRIGRATLMPAPESSHELRNRLDMREIFRPKWPKALFQPAMQQPESTPCPRCYLCSDVRTNTCRQMQTVRPCRKRNRSSGRRFIKMTYGGDANWLALNRAAVASGLV